MSSYRRTKITRLRVAGLRSLRDVELVDLPDLVVLHGPNGSGKSTLGRAVGLALKWIGLVSGQGTLQQLYPGATAQLSIEPDDFARGGTGQLTIELDIEVGPRVASILRLPSLRDAILTVRAGATDLGAERGVRIEVRKALLRRKDLADALAAKSAELDVAREEQRVTPDSLGRSRDLADKVTLLARELGVLRRSEDEDLRDQPRGLYVAQGFELVDAFRRVEREPLLARAGAIPATMLQTLLRSAALSPDPAQYEFFQSLPRLLADAGLFGGEATKVRPSEDELFGETRFLVSTPHHKDIPLTQLGTGEQQIVALVTRMCLRGAPIVLVQEPEAHLHSSTQLQLARFLERSVEAGSGSEGRARFDQLWIETHQHSFALAPEYFDVSLDADGYTKIEKKPRSLAQSHFYEPGPVFDALRQLVDETHEIGPDQVVFHDGDGKPVTAAELRTSLEGDQQLAHHYVAQVTRTVVNMLEKATRRPKP